MKINKTNFSLIIFFLFIVISFLVGFQAGESIGLNFLSFSKNMGLLLPPVFILIGLFEVWIKKETIEKHLGDDSGFKSYLFILLLSSTMIGGLVVALPVAITLLNKGAKHSVIYTFLFSSAICRIPMTFFEASFLGLKFTLIRLLISLPLILIISIIMGTKLKIPNQKTV
ncbi:MAG: permease [Bacteriovoracaceae bacterium]|nr:permease [Bacteriovoracaceae bacterium]